MFTILILAHLLGDYLFQFDFVARWKARSIWGVVAHGGIVTLTTLACVVLVDPTWWANALLIGATHTLIDVVRARLIRTKSTTWDLVFYLIDQVVHIAVIALVVTLRPSANPAAGHGAHTLLILASGYLLLLQPSWVLLRFIVRGVWGPDAAPHLGLGEKYEPMVERVLIASFVLAGQSPHPWYCCRAFCVHRVRVTGWELWLLTSHWAETLLSVILAQVCRTHLRIAVLGR